MFLVIVEFMVHGKDLQTTNKVAVRSYLLLGQNKQKNLSTKKRTIIRTIITKRD